jgi:hypothetical protein
VVYDRFHALRLSLMDVLTDTVGSSVYKSPYRSPAAPTTFQEDLALARYDAEPYYWPYAKVRLPRTAMQKVANRNVGQGMTRGD